MRHPICPQRITARKCSRSTPLNLWSLAFVTVFPCFISLCSLISRRALRTRNVRTREKNLGGGRSHGGSLWNLWHSGFLPLIVPDNSSPLSRYVHLSLTDIYFPIFASLPSPPRQFPSSLNPEKLDAFAIPDLGFTTRVELLSKQIWEKKREKKERNIQKLVRFSAFGAYQRYLKTNISLYSSILFIRLWIQAPRSKTNNALWKYHYKLE